MSNPPESPETSISGAVSPRAQSPLVDFFVWWGQELRGFFTGENTGATGAPSKALRIVVIDSETGLIAAVNPSGGAQLLARIESDIPAVGGGLTTALVAGLIACTALLAFALYQYREEYIGELAEKVDAVKQDEAALSALSEEVAGLRQRRALLTAAANAAWAGDVLNRVVALVPGTASLSGFVSDGRQVTLSGETRDRVTLIKAFTDDPAISGVTPVEPAEGENFILEMGVTLAPGAEPSLDEGAP
ncbi:MAG: hypothetical protein O2910_03605 [Proteobacteria bacterium]|nr:hypothetical protein [Pseudomonadota bacterium]